MSERRCDACLHWLAAPDSFPGEPQGQCHRHAPRPAMLALLLRESAAADDQVQWPRTYADDWCGQWQPPPVKQTAEPCPECVRLRTQLGRL